MDQKEHVMYPILSRFPCCNSSRRLHSRKQGSKSTNKSIYVSIEPEEKTVHRQDRVTELIGQDGDKNRKFSRMSKLAVPIADLE